MAPVQTGKLAQRPILKDGGPSAAEILDQMAVYLDDREDTVRPHRKEWFKDQDISRLSPEKQLIVAILVDADRLINKKKDIKGNWLSTHSQNEMKRARNWVLKDEGADRVMTFNWSCLMLDLNVDLTRSQIMEKGGFPEE